MNERTKMKDENNEANEAEAEELLEVEDESETTESEAPGFLGVSPDWQEPDYLS